MISLWIHFLDVIFENQSYVHSWVEKDAILCDIKVISHVHTESDIKVISHVVSHYMVMWPHSDITLCLKWYHLWYQSDITLGSVQCQKCYNYDFTLWSTMLSRQYKHCDITLMYNVISLPEDKWYHCDNTRRFSNLISLWFHVHAPKMWNHCNITFRFPKVISLWSHF